MRTLSDSLLAAQKEASHTPYLKIEARNTIYGVVRCDWARLYNGSEDDYFHAVAMPSDGSLLRVRVTPPTDGRKLYRQRVASPGPDLISASGLIAIDIMSLLLPPVPWEQKCLSSG